MLFCARIRSPAQTFTSLLWSVIVDGRVEGFPTLKAFLDAATGNLRPSPFVSITQIATRPQSELSARVSEGKKKQKTKHEKILSCLTLWA